MEAIFHEPVTANTGQRSSELFYAPPSFESVPCGIAHSSSGGLREPHAAIAWKGWLLKHQQFSLRGRNKKKFFMLLKDGTFHRFRISEADGKCDDICPATFPSLSVNILGGVIEICAKQDPALPFAFQISDTHDGSSPLWLCAGDPHEFKEIVALLKMVAQTAKARVRRASSLPVNGGFVSASFVSDGRLPNKYESFTFSSYVSLMM